MRQSRFSKNFSTTKRFINRSIIRYNENSSVKKQKKKWSLLHFQNSRSDNNSAWIQRIPIRNQKLLMGLSRTTVVCARHKNKFNLTAQNQVNKCKYTLVILPVWSHCIRTRKPNDYLLIIIAIYKLLLLPCIKAYKYNKYNTTVF